MKKLLIILTILFVSMCLYAQEYTFTGDHYVAKTGGEGDLCSLMIDGEEFLEASYFFNNNEPFTRTLEKVDNKLIVKSDLGTATFEFLPEKIVLTVDNIKSINYFLELKEDVFTIDNKDIANFPMLFYGKTRVIKNKAAIESDGDMKLWGPWKNKCAYDYYFLGNPGKISQTFTPCKATDFEYKIVNHIPFSFNLYSPLDYEVFQRQTKTMGYIDFSGFVKPNVTSVQYKIEGKDLYNKSVNMGWKSLKTDKFGVFKEKVKVRAGGWYKVQLKYIEDNVEKIEVIDHVGVGEVIVGAGQSNSTNCGQFPSKQTSGMVSTTDGVHWKYGDDPMIGVHDKSTGGSLYPALGDALYKEFNVPVGIAATGYGGTSIEQWQPNAPIITGNLNLYNWFMSRVYNLGEYGFRCVVWHQGEANANSSVEASYKGMVNLIETSRKDAGWYIPWFVAKASYWNMENPSFEEIRSVHQKLWNEKVALEGPDTDTMKAEYRDWDGAGIHFGLKGLKRHGEYWAEFLIPYIHSKID